MKKEINVSQVLANLYKIAALHSSVNASRAEDSQDFCVTQIESSAAAGAYAYIAQLLRMPIALQKVEMDSLFLGKVPEVPSWIGELANEKGNQ
jgi:hypothetical protein